MNRRSLRLWYLETATLVVVAIFAGGMLPALGLHQEQSDENSPYTGNPAAQSQQDPTFDTVAGGVTGRTWFGLRGT